MSAKDLGPLDWRIAITDRNGRPTPEFQRRWTTQRNNNELIGVHLGTGVPTLDIVDDGEQYVDTSQTPGVLYVSSGGVWVQVGAVKFIQLEDAPNSYSGAASKLVRVNSGATALEFDSLTTVLDSLGSAQGDILYRNASGWVVLPPGTSGYLLQTGGTSANPSWVTAPTTLPSIANNDLLANTSGGSAVPVGTTVSALLDSALGNAQGDILYRNATGWTVLTPGTSGFVLTSGGAGANPAWASSSIPAIANNNLLANTSGVSATPVATTLTALIDSALGSAQGDIMYRNATTWTVLTPGTSGNLLSSGGASANPSWVTAPTGLSSIANNSLLANTSGSTAVPVATTLTALIDAALGSAQGDILYRNSSGWTVLAPGTSGYVLQTGGASANPSWVAQNSTSLGNPFGYSGGGPQFRWGSGAPGATTDPEGSLYIDASTPALYQQLTPTATPAFVQAKNLLTAGSVTLASAPTAGNLLVVVAWQGATINTGGGWTDSGIHHSPAVFDLEARVGYKIAALGETTTQTPCSGTGYYSIFEISGATWASLEGSQYTAQNSGGTAVTISYTTLANNDLVIGSYAIANGATVTSLAVTGTVTANPTTLYGLNPASQQCGLGTTAQVIASAGGQSATATFNAGQAASGILIAFASSTGSYRRIDGAAISGANPTATASDTAVNGSATTFMRSDAAPAIQKASSSQFGLVKVDGTTITATAGVISASGGGGGTTNNYYAGAMTLISSQTLSGAAASVTFSTIPSGYQDLVLVIQARGDTASTATDVKVQFNGDTATNYRVGNTTASGSATASSSSASFAGIQLGLIPAASATASFPGQIEASFPNYSGTTFNKTANAIHNSYYGSTVNQIVGEMGGSWASTAAITSVLLACGAGNFAAGSTFQLYGRGGSNVVVNAQPGLPVISEVVTSGSQTTVTVSSIPATYRDLRVVVTGRSTAATTGENLIIYFNGDSTSGNYAAQSQQANTTTLSGATSVNRLAGFLPGASATANQAGTADILVPSYSSTTFIKQWLASSGVPGYPLLRGASGRWNVTTAISSVTIAFESGAAFTDGTIVTVYGVGGSTTATLPVVPPQGRLTLTSNTPVMTADATAQTTVYYTPYVGTLLPVGNIMYRFSQLSYVLNTTAHTSTNLYDIFAFNSSGTITLGTGPAWTNSTTRSNAISMDAVNGIWKNTSSITLNLSGGTTTTTVAAAQATYLGTFYATANGQTGMAFKPTAASGGANNILGLYNAYNRVRVMSLNRDSAADYTYNSLTWRTANASSSNRISWVDGLQQSPIEAFSAAVIYSNAVSGVGYVGTVIDSTTATPTQYNGGGSTITSTITVGGGSIVENFLPLLGFHYAQRMEHVTVGTATWSNSTTSLIVDM